MRKRVVKMESLVCATTETAPGIARQLRAQGFTARITTGSRNRRGNLIVPRLRWVEISQRVAVRF